MVPPLALACRYYPGSIPPRRERFRISMSPAAENRGVAHDALRSVLVEYAHQRFPGICWSRSPLEAIQYMRSRVLPDARRSTSFASPWMRNRI
jgi:hypothetical protein